MKKLLLWVMETRPQFLTLSMVLTFLGTAIAWHDGPVNLGYALLAGFGLMLTHGSVNAINDYFDYKSGIDLAVERTPFSGGSGLVPEGKLSLRQALMVGIITALAALLIGGFFIAVRGWLLLPLIVAAGLLLVLYTPVILKTPWPEWSPGLGLGILPILGFYFIQTGRYDIMVVVAAIPSGILVHNLLLLNEFPDVAADRQGGRRTTPVLFGLEPAAQFFMLATLAVYIWTIGCVLATLFTGQIFMPVYALLTLLAAPWGVKAVRGARKHHDRDTLIRALGDNVKFILSVQVLLGAGYILDKVCPLS